MKWENDVYMLNYIGPIGYAYGKWKMNPDFLFIWHRNECMWILGRNV